MRNYRFLILTKAVSVALAKEYPILALDTLCELTQRFTAEFDVRYLLRQHYELTLSRLHDWTRHPSPHVRRLVSEGARPRLPWATHLDFFKRDPGDLIDLLSLLHRDPSRYVRLSVANCVADILKDNRETGFQLLYDWLTHSTESHVRWVIRRSIRHQLAKGDGLAAELLAAANER